MAVPVSEQPLNPSHTFDSFVVGPCNRLAHAAALAIADAPGMAYNPLFVYGAAGLGKTHLLHATCDMILKRFPSLRVIYLTCDAFINQAIAAIKATDPSVPPAYRTADVLVVDDIHALRQAERTQEEFFHTFNALYNAQKQVILSSDRPPKGIPNLEERLLSRFKWGLIAHLEPPDFETRFAIVQNKAARRGVAVPEGVARFLATEVTDNVRELEGALVTLIGYASLTNRRIDLTLAHEVFHDLGSEAKSISLDDMLPVVARHFQVKVAELKSRQKARSVAFPRQVCMYLARELTHLSLEDVGWYFGGRDHTTVLYAYEKVRQQAAQDASLRQTLERIAADLGRTLRSS